ncbi:MAG TPA: DinB family protein [Pyrinomonadaceae bacterium]|nr:DinB family protein [Pyrinomonadaceae bacterium]
MKYESIADIFSANSKIREGLEIVLGGVSPDEATAVPDGENWSIQQIVEHLSMVESGALRICSKLLDAARTDNKSSDGSFSLSEEFNHGSEMAAAAKFQAPERVVPTGDVAMAESLQRLAEARVSIEAMQPDMERLDLSGHTFPHPFFGNLTAAQWLVVAGGHEMRHTLQIQRVLEQIRS